MGNNKTIKALECCIHDENSCDRDCPFIRDCDKTFIAKNALDLIKHYEAENEKLHKECDELVKKIEYLLCQETGYRYSKHTYTKEEMVTFVDDYIQECCDKAVEEAKPSIKSEARDELVKKLKEKLQWDVEFDNKLVFESDIDNLLKEMKEE